MQTDRRRFLQGGLAAGACSLMGAPLSAALRSSSTDPVLVSIQATGGYDLFNMLVPDHPLYRTARPSLGITPAETLGEVESGSSLYWHPSLAPLRSLYDAGRAAVVLNVGYPDPDLSHFESRKVWAAGDRNFSKGKGWLGEYLRQGFGGGERLVAMDVSGAKNPAFGAAAVPVLRSPDSYALKFDPNSTFDTQLEEFLLRVGATWKRDGERDEKRSKSVLQHGGTPWVQLSDGKTDSRMLAG